MESQWEEEEGEFNARKGETNHDGKLMRLVVADLRCTNVSQR